MMKAIALMAVVAVCASLVETARAQPALPNDVALYAGGSLTFDSFSAVRNGDVIAGGDVTHNGGLLFVESIFSAGGFSAQGAAFQNSRGQWLFNNDIINLGGPGSEIGGDVASTAGNIDFLDSSLTVDGDVTAAGNIEWLFPFGQVTGNLTAGGTADVTAQVDGVITSGATVNLPTYVPPSLPAGRNLTPSSNDITLNAFDDIALPPGNYGDLTFASGNTVELVTGQYVFNDIINSFSLNELSFDTSAGPIDLYVKESFTFNMVQVINGERLFVGGNPDPADAAKIFIEVGNHFTGDADMYGTVFAPNGNIVLEHFADVTGRIFAGGNVKLYNVDINAPEPGSAMVMMALALGGLMKRRRVSV